MEPGKCIAFQKAGSQTVESITYPMDVACAIYFLPDCTDSMSFDRFLFSANERITSEDFGDAYPVGSIECSAAVLE
jgi:hypothetical protein